MESGHTGIDFINRVEETDSLHVMNFEYIYNGAGVGIVDLNNDGLQDIIFAGNQVSPRVYLNEGDFRFRDITSSFRDIDNGQWYSGITYVDINNDGWNDIYMTCTAYDEPAEIRKNRLFVNQGLQENGELLFIDMAEAYGIDDDSYSVHAAFFDYDLDGDLDLYIMNNFENDRLSSSYRPKVNDGTAASNDDLYRNNGDGTFTNVTIEAGIIYEGFGLGLAIGDVNKDGYPDIYVSNDYIANDLLYINQGDGTFKNEIARYMSYQTKSSMGNDMADINNDGFPDMYTLDMLPEHYHKKKQTINGFGYIYYINDMKLGYEHQYLRNMLHLHNGLIDGQLIPYSEVGQIMGIYQTEWSWSPLFADYDNDGDKDLIVANGYPRDMTDKDWTRMRFQLYPSVASAEYVISKVPAAKVANHAYENIGDLRFSRVPPGEWFREVPSYSYGAAFVDLDNDGDLDYVTNNTNDPPFIYRNNTRERSPGTSNYLRIKLAGLEDNAPAFGAKVELWSGGGYQFQEHFLSRGYTSTVDPVVHFGLGEGTRIDSIRVVWPASGRVSFLEDIPANRLLEIDEAGAVVPEPEKENMASAGNPGRMFTGSGELLHYLHEQIDVIDFHYSQNIIPHKFSQIGPILAHGDLNGDGLEDIIIGATDLLPTMVFLGHGEGFVRAAIPGLTGEKEITESAFEVLDVDLDGDNDVIVLSGGYESRDESDYVHYLYENKGGHFERHELPAAPSSSSVVRACDFDQDGYPDLFIGSRVKMEMFPFAADSWILINDGGRFPMELAMNFNLGMVTDAVWSDYDGDGWEDLLVAREWNSPAVIRNLKGERLVSQDIPVIDSLHGIWYSITAADLNGDGNQDYILGNLGNNHRFTVSERYPLRMYAFDLDLNGSLDPIATGYWKDREGVMQEYPVNYLDELVGQSAYFMKRFPDYTSFSYVTFKDMLDSSMLERIDYTFHVNTTSSHILWNRGEGNFSWEELPRKAQVSPIKHTIVRDFNGDGLPDVILAGNDHSYDISTGYFDASKGLILLSRDGVPLKDLVQPAGSGLVLHGMVESLLWLEKGRERPLLVAGFNRDSAKVYTFNGLPGQ